LPYSQTPVYLGEFGTGNNESDLTSSPLVRGSEGQWFTDLVNFILSSYTLSSDSTYQVMNLQWTYWALNTEDGFALLGTNYSGLANSDKEYTYLCSIQQPDQLISPPPVLPPAQCTDTLPTPM